MVQIQFRSDEEIGRDVRRALEWDRRVQPSDIAAAVLRGIVTLTGTVDSLFQRWAAEDVAASVRGVRGVTNDIEVRLPVGHERNDVDLSLAVARALALDPALAERAVTAIVFSGQVTLEGDVEDPREKDTAARNASQVFGVREVVNHISLRESASSSPALHM
jgi:osmotically-inducible protein OsmY